MIMEPATSNIIHMNGVPVTEAFVQFAWGFGHAIGQKVKLCGLRSPLAIRTPIAIVEREIDNYGIQLSKVYEDWC
jgi:hypothetical protein